MVKISHAIHLIVTIQTGCTKLRNMLVHKCLIVLRMTIDTNAEVELVQVIGVAGRAGDRNFRIIFQVAIEAETGIDSMIEFLVIQQSRAPGFRIVAAGTIQGEESRVSGWFLVAIHACRRETLELPSSVTSDAAGLLMFTDKWKGGLIVVKSHHAILAIMAIKTIFSKILDVPCHEGCILTAMAICASVHRDGIADRIHMTDGTCHRSD